MRYEMFDTESKIHISAGLPCLSILPFSHILETVSNDFGKEYDSALLQYGFPSGYKRFRKKLAKFIGNQEQKIVNPERLFITNRATHGILLSIIALCKGSASVIMERPTYFPLIDLFRELNLNLYFANVDKEGISSHDICNHLKNITGPTFIHCIPYFQNPTGVCISKNRTIELLDILKNNKNVWLLSDNVYEYLNFSTNINHDVFNNYTKRIINIGSFSKIFGPGL